MSFNHTFNASVIWKLSEGDSTNNLRSFSRNHTVHISDSKPGLSVSAAKPFRGDDTLHNPEDLLLSALASCHLMSYLYVCAQYEIEVLHYTDTAEAFLEMESSGAGQFSRAILKPVVIIKDASQIELATHLHSEAHKLCFIANSCSFPVEINPTISISEV